jgi:hypothetical protein
MVSTVASFIALAIPLWAVSGQNPVTGKAWDARVIPRCEDMVPAEIQRKWKLEAKPPKWNPDANFGPTCPFTNGDQSLSVVYECGKSKLDTPAPSKGGFGVVVVEVTGIGRRAIAIASSKTKDLWLSAFDDDTPCEISFRWPDPNGLDTAKRLMQDLLTAATPARVGKSRLEANYLDPESPAGRALFSSPEAWKKEAAGIEGLINLAPGYPRVVEGKTLPGLPDGNVALLGLCPIGTALADGGWAMPGILRTLIDAPPSAEACPKGAFPGENWQLDEDTEVQLGGRTLGMNLLHWEDRNAHAWARAYLRDKDGSLLSVATEQVQAYSPSNWDKCTPKLRKTKSGAVFKVTCVIAIPDKCKKNPSWWLTHTIKVSGDKVTIKSDQKFENGIDCMPTAE